MDGVEAVITVGAIITTGENYWCKRALIGGPSYYGRRIGQLRDAKLIHSRQNKGAPQLMALP